MKYLKLSILMLIISVSFYGCMKCQNNVVFTSPFVDNFLNTYQFELLDSSGSKIIEGTLRPKKYYEPDFEGIYTITKFHTEEYSSLFGSNGTLTGNLDEKTKRGFINFNPRIADNNIFLRFDVTGTELKGTWEHSTMIGIKAKGEFNAKQIKP